MDRVPQGCVVGGFTQTFTTSCSQDDRHYIRQHGLARSQLRPHPGRTRNPSSSSWPDVDDCGWAGQDERSPAFALHALRPNHHIASNRDRESVGQTGRMRPVRKGRYRGLSHDGGPQGRAALVQCQSILGRRDEAAPNPCMLYDQRKRHLPNNLGQDAPTNDRKFRSPRCQ